MDWYKDDELRKQWEEVSSVEEKLRRKKTEGYVLRCDALQLVREILASQERKGRKKESRRMVHQKDE